MVVVAFFILAALVSGAEDANVVRMEPVAVTNPFADLSNDPIFLGSNGARSDWTDLFAAMDEADVVIWGEQHMDASAHALQRHIIAALAGRWRNWTLSLEEFDRSQQPVLQAFLADELTGEELKAVANIVSPDVRRNWLNWYFPKLVAAREDGAALLAANAPLRYSRLVRNVGCEDLPDLEPEESALFDCPALPLDQGYRDSFAKTMKGVAARNQAAGLKPLQEEQIEKMFRAHRVWDATMAESIARARDQGAGKLVQVVGSFHSDRNGGLVQELRHRDPDAKILTICFASKRGRLLAPVDMGRADFIIYTRGS